MLFFSRLARSWEFAKISYGILWDFKQLILFPILSTLALILVTASFLLPLFGLNLLQTWFGGANHSKPPAAFWVVAFAFYFCSYFVMVFFNTALAACALRVIGGEAPTLGDGLAVAAKRLPQIAAWALVSAVVGMLLQVVENAHEKAGQVIAALLGSAWSALTYLVVPVIAAEGVGPVDCVKRSFETIKETWGEALAGNGGIGLIGFLVMVPVTIVGFIATFMAFSAGGLPVGLTVMSLFVLVGLVISAANSAANTIFRAVLYNFATGKTLPANIDAATLQQVFTAKE